MRAFRLDVDGAKKSKAKLAAIAFAANGARHRIHEIAAFGFAVPAVGDCFPGGGERRRISADVRAIRHDAVGQIEPVDMHRRMTGRGLLGINENILAG